LRRSEDLAARNGFGQSLTGDSRIFCTTFQISDLRASRVRKASRIDAARDVRRI
jgi:hypothetical protein